MNPAGLRAWRLFYLDSNSRRLTGGFCCLRPGVPGFTENIRVRSIIGRFLEHSRMFHFANGEDDPSEGDLLIGSADWMYRYLSKRIEVVTPVTDGDASEKLWKRLDIYLDDRRQAWVLDATGSYAQLQPEGGSGQEMAGSHRALMLSVQGTGGAEESGKRLRLDLRRATAISD